MNERLYRARDERMFLGVLGGVSLRLGIDPSLVRIAYAIGTILTGIFPLIIVYFVMAIVIPEAPDGWEAEMRAGVAAPAPPADWMQPREPGLRRSSGSGWASSCIAKCSRSKCRRLPISQLC